MKTTKCFPILKESNSKSIIIFSSLILTLTLTLTHSYVWSWIESTTCKLQSCHRPMIISYSHPTEQDGFCFVCFFPLFILFKPYISYVERSQNLYIKKEFYFLKAPQLLDASPLTEVFWFVNNSFRPYSSITSFEIGTNHR